MTNIGKLAVVQALIFVAGLVCIEFALRYIMPLPVHGGIYHAKDGTAVRVAQDKFTLKPNLEVTHVASEFLAEIRTNELGYRKLVNEINTPDYLFLGDSFTFGHGVSNRDTFASIFCEAYAHTCLNLGRSGTNTISQLQVLRYAIDTHGVRPKTVVLVMLTACWMEQSGNDLGDNLKYYLAKKKSRSSEHVAFQDDGATFRRSANAQMPAAGGQPLAVPPASISFVKRIQSWFGNLEITKRAMLALSSQLKSGFYACSDQEPINTAIAATRAALMELERLAAEHRFDVKVISIHPYQELDGAFRTTEANLRTAVPETFDYIETGQRFSKKHYFSYDGHFNASGHANMASIIESYLTEKQTQNPSP